MEEVETETRFCLCLLQRKNLLEDEPSVTETNVWLEVHLSWML